MSGIALVLTALLALFLIVRAAQPFLGIPPELARKLFHVGGGLVTLGFPWLFSANWPVIVLAGFATLALLLVRYARPARRHLGGVLYGVERDSVGELCFPLAAAALFVLAERDPIFYCIPLSLLVLSDAAAALVGIEYGRRRYTTAGGYKSAEGSIAFCACSFLCVHVPLLLATELGRAETLLIALTLAILVTLIEGVAWHGLDNLFVPLFGFLILQTFVEMDVATLVGRLVAVFLLIILVVALRRLAALRGDALLAAALFGYVAWALGGFAWLLVPLVMFLVYPFLLPPNAASTERIHGVLAVFAVTAPAAAWLFAARVLERPDFLFGYTLVFAGNLALLGVVRYGHDRPSVGWPVILLACTVKAWLLTFLPYALVSGLAADVLWRVAAAPLAIAAAAGAFMLLQPGLRNCPTDPQRWLRQGALAAAGSLLGLVAFPA